MKCSLAFITLFMLVAVAYSYPTLSAGTEQLDDALWEPAGEITQEHVARLKRASCDLFSFQSQWVTPNHAVCAAHCIVLGNRGGECKGTVCHCRK